MPIQWILLGFRFPSITSSATLSMAGRLAKYPTQNGARVQLVATVTVRKTGRNSHGLQLIGLFRVNRKIARTVKSSSQAS